MMRRRKTPRRTPSMIVILVLLVVGMVAAVLCLCVPLFIGQYRTAVVQSARTSGEQAVFQVANTVGDYNAEMHEVLAMLEDAPNDQSSDREAFFASFLRMRPDVVAVSSYDASGTLLDCWALDREPKTEIFKNLSFNPELAAGGGYVTAAHVESLFVGYLRGL